MRIFVAVWIGFLMMAAIAMAAGCRSDAFGRERKERLTEIDAAAVQREVVVSAPFPDGITAKCLFKEEDDGVIWLTFLMNDESEIPVLAPDDGAVGISSDYPRTLTIAASGASIVTIRNIKGANVHAGEDVVRGEPMGFAGSSDYFGAEVTVGVHALREDAAVIWRVTDETTRESGARTADEFVCGYREGHLYGSRNAPAYNHPRGTLIKRRGEGQVYEVRDGTRQEVLGDLSACAALEALPLVEVGPAEMNCLKEWGDPIDAASLCARLAMPATGSLIHFPMQASAFVVDGGVLRPIADQNTFHVLGYDWAMVREMSETALEIMSADMAHPFTLRDARNCISGEPFPEAPL